MELEARTILSADIAGFDRLLADDRGAATGLWNDAWVILEDQVERHGGNRINLVTPEYMASFSGALNAFSCAVMSLRAFSRKSEGNLDWREHSLRIGLRQDDTRSRDDCPPLSELRALASAGGICLSYPVYEEIEDQLGKLREANRDDESAADFHQELRRILGMAGPTRSPVIKLNAALLLGKSKDSIQEPASVKSTKAGLEGTKGFFERTIARIVSRKGHG